MVTSRINICLIQHSTRSDNLGVGALTVAELQIIRNILDDINVEANIFILDWKDPGESYIHGPYIKKIEIDRKFMIYPSGFYRTVRDSDLVIDIGAGDSFTDIYGSSRLKRILFLKALTLVAGTPMIMAPQTIGPFKKTSSSILAGFLMRRSVFVATRDKLSTAVARKMRIRNLVEASDVALRLPFEEPAEKLDPGHISVGLNVSALLMNGGYTRQNQFQLCMDYPALIRELITSFQGMGCRVHLVPHVVSRDPGRTHVEDDVAANEALAIEFPGVICAPRFSSPSEAKTYISGLDFFLGARMHACIAALSTGVPVVPLAYSRKFQGLFGTLGYKYVIDCTKENNANAISKIMSYYETRDVLAEDAKAALDLGLAKLKRYEASLSKLMSSLLG